MGQWVKIEHPPGGLFASRYNASDWLAMQLNKLGTTNHPVIIDHDQKEGIFEAIVYIGDEVVSIDNQNQELEYNN